MTYRDWPPPRARAALVTQRADDGRARLKFFADVDFRAGEQLIVQTDREAIAVFAYAAHPKQRLVDVGWLDCGVIRGPVTVRRDA